MTETTSAVRAPIWPSFRYRDAPAAICFLAEAFGFEPVLVVPGEDDGTVAHAELLWPGGGGIMLGSHRTDEMRWLPGAGSVYIATPDVAALYERVQRAGADIVHPLRDEEYGSQTFAVRDPEGVLWTFGTYAGSAGR